MKHERGLYYSKIQIFVYFDINEITQLLYPYNFISVLPLIIKDRFSILLKKGYYT